MGGREGEREWFLLEDREREREEYERSHMPRLHTWTKKKKKEKKGKTRFFRCNKKLDLHVKRKLELNDQAGICPQRNFYSLVVETRGYKNLAFGEKECRNYIEQARRLRLGMGDAQAIHNYFVRMQANNSNFFYLMNLDEDCRLRNLFWADAKNRTAFEAWLACMSWCPLRAIITDQYKAMQRAIERVVPNTRHRRCLWHIMKKVPEKLRCYSQYEGIKTTLQNVVYDSFTKDEFEEGWTKMIEKYDLYDNKWLGGLYDERH
ncbi:hypothetical protein L1049_005932 [Liquidambar formosana]|uniref:MULE transposase domain-containing protein n=1 Tax=Liquidambar formosana TaxID=63359 RepID=A0AAP0WQQ0_LIQFO